MRYFEDAKRIWKTCVPKAGQSQTVEGELLRAVEKFRDEATRNGNGNWDSGFEILLAYLQQHLLDAAVFAPSVLESTMASIARLSRYDDPYLEDDLYAELTDRVVEYFRFYGSKSHAKNPLLYR
jgi:hypothetical protein